MVPPYVRRPAQERQLAFNPEAPTFSPNAPAFQSTSIPSPAAQATSSGGYYDGYGTPPPYRGLTTANSHRNDGGYEAGNAASCKFEFKFVDSWRAFKANYRLAVPPFPSDPWMMNTIQAPAGKPTTFIMFEI
jgi:hypothetical protein